MAEQQLPVPGSWLQCDEDAMEQAPSPSSNPLQCSKEQQQGHEAAVITGANDLRIEVRQSDSLTPMIIIHLRLGKPC